MKQLTSRTNGLKKVARNATFNTRLMVANDVFMSKVMYLMTVWGGAQQYLLKGLQVQQLTPVEAGPKRSYSIRGDGFPSGSLSTCTQFSKLIRQ